jgi:hypothetical protein
MDERETGEFLSILREYSEQRDTFHQQTQSAVLMAGEKRGDTIHRFVAMVNGHSMSLNALLPLMSLAEVQALSELVSNMLSMRRMGTEGT